jgi:hypothetical protein
MHNGQAISFNREGTAKDNYPSRTDHRPDSFAAGQIPSIWHHGGSYMFAFAVPAGRWRVNYIASWIVLNFCLGSPSFDVAAGDVVYAGAFDFSGQYLGPDLDLAPAKAWLAGLPQALTVRPAVYLNGSLGVCGNNEIYALEVKGAPFEPGYVWGGATQSGQTITVPKQVATVPAVSSPAAETTSATGLP